MALNISEANAINKLLRRMLDPNTTVTEDTIHAAVSLLAASAYKQLKAGLTPDDVAELWANRSDKDATDGRWDLAVDWLLNSRHTGDPGIQTAFWGVVDGRWSVDDADRGALADGTRLRDVPKPDDE